jgi:apolipoprotein N-acyltransferase
VKARLPSWFGPTLFTCLLFWLTQPPLALAYIPFVALTPWLAWMRDAPAKEARQSGAFFGVFYGLSQMWFILVLLKNYTGSLWIGVVPYLVIALMGALFYWLMAGAIHRCFLRGMWWLIPFIWAGGEAFRAFIGPVPFPWGILAHPLWSVPQLAQAASGGTVFFVSAWCAAVSLLAVWVFFPYPKDSEQASAKSPSGNFLFRWTMACCAVAIFSLWRFSQAPLGARKVITLGQPGINLAYLRGEEREAAVQLSGRQLEARVLRQGKTDLLLLPEGYVRGGESPPANPFGPTPTFPVIFGGSHYEGDQIKQGAWAWDPAKQEWSVTSKERLVIFGETLPLSDIIPYRDWLNLGFKSFSPGRHQLLEVSGMKIGCSICYEGLFSDLASRFSNEGAQLLAVISIDDWYVHTPAWESLWQSTVWRSIESGLPVVRSGGLGRTLATDARGRMLVLAPPNERLAARVELTIPDQSDAFPYRIVFPWICIALLFGILGDWAWNFMKEKKAKPETES